MSLRSLSISLNLSELVEQLGSLYVPSRKIASAMAGSILPLLLLLSELLDGIFAVRDVLQQSLMFILH